MSLSYPQVTHRITGNTSGTTAFISTGTYFLSGGNNITLSQNGQTVEISAGAGGAGATNSIGVSNLGNTIGTTGVLTSDPFRMVFVGGNAITLSQSVNGASATITISGSTPPAPTLPPDQIIGMSNLGNTSGTSGPLTTNEFRYVFAGGNNITLSQSVNAGSATLTISAGAGAAGPAASFFNHPVGVIGATQTQTVRQSTSYIFPFALPYDISISHLRFPVTMSVGNTTSIATTNGATGSCSILSTYNAVIYKQNTGASSLSLSSIASGSEGFTQRWSLSANATAGSVWTLSQTVSFDRSGSLTSYTTQVATSLTNYSLGSLSLTLFTGLRGLDIPFATSLPASNYWLMYGGSSTTSTGGIAAMTNLRISCSNLMMTQVNLSLGNLGEAINASNQYMSGIGSFTTAGGGTTASLGRSNISSSASHGLPWFQMIRIT